MFGPDEDPDMNIYFDQVTLMEYLANLEEDNLFKINLVQEDEQALENEKKKIQENIKNKEEEIAEVLKNIESLEQSKGILQEKQMYLEGSMKVKHTGNSKDAHNMQKMQSAMMQIGTETSVIESGGANNKN